MAHSHCRLNGLAVESTLDFANPAIFTVSGVPDPKEPCQGSCDGRDLQDGAEHLLCCSARLRVRRHGRVDVDLRLIFRAKLATLLANFVILVNNVKDYCIKIFTAQTTR